MKTIAEIVKENEPWTKHIVAALEARERERDAAEQKRVRSVLAGYITLDKMHELYPPPKQAITNRYKCNSCGSIYIGEKESK